MDYPIVHPPLPGHTIRVAPGILWLRMPLPFALNHINLWLIEDGAGWAVVDTGVPDQESRRLWQGVFAGPMGGRPLSRLVVTHFHPDHMGLASWLERQFGIVMEATQAEWLYGRMLSLDTSESFVEASRRFYQGTGFGEDLLAIVTERGNAYGARIKHVPTHCRRLRDGSLLDMGGRRWRVMVGEGHAPELACLWCEDLNVLISSDQILPSISPNVSVWPSEPEADPLRQFLESLKRFRELPGDCLVLPSHGRPFVGLHERIDALLAHHRDRLDETLEACAQPMTAFDLQAIMFRRPLDSHQVFFAIGESLAHLHYLAAEGQIIRETDAKGVHRFRRC
ncbi:MBL fold metallo-hydrolase [Telmatospirillum sp.]|uniref:MBL fold metallo-hydrolase n=1 Tax=Telmatospirillum sp. TaxID=2079197 RepID=UPI00283C24FC|nr:MBL fold metallo-hydrolase [Telmatospirillum sp.]MDR3437181.1 MBL fold metallo-hydrolase [Telmatospirillum sp.]